MDVDLFGYTRAKAGSYLLSSDYAAIYFANIPGGAAASAERLGLVQNASLAYDQNVQPRFETGSAELFWLTGQSIGELRLSRLVGERGILEGVNFGNNPNALRKGVLGNVEFKSGRLNFVDTAVRQDVIVLSGCVLSNVGLEFGVGSFDIRESLVIRAAMAKRVTRS